MYSLGHDFVPPPIHAGGLRYHGMAPLVCQCVVEGLHTPRAIDQVECYEAALLWARTEGFICAPETSHDACAIQEARKAKEEGKERSSSSITAATASWISGYDAFMSGKLLPYELPDSELEKAQACLKKHPRPRCERPASGKPCSKGT